ERHDFRKPTAQCDVSREVALLGFRPGRWPAPTKSVRCTTLEGHSRLYLKSARCHEVRAAEGRKEIVQRDFVRDVDSSESERHLRVFSTEKIVCAHAKVEQAAWRNAWRIRVVILSAISRNSNSEGATVRRSAGGDGC